jgi:hypothetical protein
VTRDDLACSLNRSVMPAYHQVHREGKRVYDLVRFRFEDTGIMALRRTACAEITPGRYIGYINGLLLR